jgi:membrane protein implicated in regulation of membrane protease activity
MAELEFADSWLWLVFIGVGLLLASLELIAGVETGFDLVVIGSVFIIGGLVTFPFHSWVPAVVVTSVICVAYVAVGRRYIHRWTATRAEKTNIDAIVGRRGIVLRDIAKYVDGLVKIDNQQWRARAEENIKEGDEVVVAGVSGATLIVNKTEGGD